MSSWDLLAGLTQGGQAMLKSYMDTSEKKSERESEEAKELKRIAREDAQRAQDLKYKDRSLAGDEYSKGLIVAEGPDGKFNVSENQAKILSDRKRRAEEIQMNKIADGTDISVDPTTGGISYGGMNKKKLADLKAIEDMKKDPLDAEKKRAEINKLNRENGVDGVKLSDGQKAVDKDYAKHYNDFTGKGKVNSIQTIKQLKELKSQLESEGGGLFSAGGGRVASLLPDNLRSSKAISWKTEIPGKANLVLKDLFGGQLSDKEREAESKTYYNDLLSPKENAVILQKKIDTLENQLVSEDAKAKYYQQNGTLRGFEVDDSGEMSAEGLIKPEQGLVPRGLIQQQEKKAEAPPKPGTVVDGYSFKGGDPSKPENWEVSKKAGM